jgi:hypothetical protein
VLVPDPVALAPEYRNVTVVEQAVEDGGGHDGITRGRVSMCEVCLAGRTILPCMQRRLTRRK